MITKRILTGFAIAVAAFVGSFSLASAQPSQRPALAVSAAKAQNGFPAPHCSRPADQEAARIDRLVAALRDSRAAAEQNPLLLADVGYYEAELAASRRCLTAVAAR
jgi:hypothetical protein